MKSYPLDNDNDNHVDNHNHNNVDNDNDSMAPSMISPILNGLMPKTRRVSGAMDSESMSNKGMSRSMTSQRVTSRRFNNAETSNVSNVVSSIQRRSVDELGATTSSKLMDSTHDSLLGWIRAQRMTHLPPEGSSYDKVLAWAQLFAERLNSFDLEISEFAVDSFRAAELAYGYCAILLEVRSPWASSSLNDLLLTHFVDSAG